MDKEMIKEYKKDIEEKFLSLDKNRQKEMIDKFPNHKQENQ